MKSIDTKKPLTILADEGAFKVNIKELNMTSMSLQQITVPFHNAELFLVEHNGQPFTPMKPIVEGMGLDWSSQFVKLKQRFAKGIVEITIPSNGGLQTMICLMLRKLPAWLYSIQSGKVKPEIRDSVIMYQEECDDVLWDYWTKGIAINPRSTKQEREPLTNAVNMLVAKTKHLNYSDAYKLVHQRFNVKHIDEIPYDEIPVAVEYVHHLIALYNASSKQGSLFDDSSQKLIEELANAILNQNCMTSCLYRAAHAINPENAIYYADLAFETNFALLKLSRSLNIRGPNNRKLISDDLKTASFTMGNQHFGSRWFHPLIDARDLIGLLQTSRI